MCLPVQLGAPVAVLDHLRVPAVGSQEDVGSGDQPVAGSARPLPPSELSRRPGPGDVQVVQARMTGTPIGPTARASAFMSRVTWVEFSETAGPVRALATRPRGMDSIADQAHYYAGRDEIRPIVIDPFEAITPGPPGRGYVGFVIQGYLPLRRRRRRSSR